MPKRIQRKRVKGWRKPEGAVIVCRPSRFGNPFTRRGCREAGYTGSDAEIKVRCVESFRVWLTSQDWQLNWSGPESEARRAYILEHLSELRGKDLICYCDLREPCHADVLLELANSVEPLKSRIHTLDQLQLETLDLIRKLRFQLQRQAWEPGLSDKEFLSQIVQPLEEKIYQDRRMAKMLS